jgi:hypothetical protein
MSLRDRAALTLSSGRTDARFSPNRTEVQSEADATITLAAGDVRAGAVLTATSSDNGRSVGGDPVGGPNGRV